MSKTVKRRKYTDDQVAEVIDMHRMGASIRQICLATNIDRTTIKRMIEGDY